MGKIQDDTTGDGVTVGGSLTTGRVAATYGTTVGFDSSQGNVFSITVTDGVAFAIAAPQMPRTGKQIIVTIRNTSGGAHGAITWNAVFKMAVLAAIATGFSRTIGFVYDGTNWVETFKTPADVAN